MKTPLRPKPWQQLLSEANRDSLVPRIIGNPAIKPTVGGRYRHWDALRHLDPPGDLSHEEWWLGIKFARQQLAQPLPLTDTEDLPFTVTTVGPIQQMLRRIDQDASGQIFMSEHVANPDTRRTYLVSSLIEEAITSSQLEGASTSKRVAEEMLRSGRSPRNKSERMILNNYQAMNLVREHRDNPITPEFVLELHRVVTDGTLENPDAAGSLQRADEERVQVLDEAGRVLHSPPPAESLPTRLEAMCDFGNGEEAGDDYLHPVVRSVVLHFWLGYDHPFEDGNGRTARALFYWSMLHRRYWLTEYLTISSILKKAPAKYARSFLYSEWDDNDLTYFLAYQLEVVIRAIESLQEYLRRKMKEIRETEELLKATNLNHRQITLLGHALRKPGAVYTFKSHARSHGVVYQSARTDLLDLEERGYLERRRDGRTYRFHAPVDLPERLKTR